MDEKWQQLKDWINESDNIVFFGGAGVSTESGIPDFRSADGLYSQGYTHPPEAVVSRTFFEARPKDFYDFYCTRMVDLDAKPNRAHRKLAELERRRKATLREHSAKTKADSAYNAEYERRMSALKERYARECSGEITAAQRARNLVLAKEVCLSLGRYPLKGRRKLEGKLYDAIKQAMTTKASIRQMKETTKLRTRAIISIDAREK